MFITCYCVQLSLEHAHTSFAIFFFFNGVHTEPALTSTLYKSSNANYNGTLIYNIYHKEVLNKYNVYYIEVICIHFCIGSIFETITKYFNNFLKSMSSYIVI